MSLSATSLVREVDSILDDFGSWRAFNKQHFSKEEQACEIHFKKTIAKLDSEFKSDFHFRPTDHSWRGIEDNSSKRLLCFGKKVH
jgi:hypothetical protein